MAGTNDAAAASAVEGTANEMTGLVKTKGGGVDSEVPGDVGRMELATKEMTDTPPEVEEPPIRAGAGGPCPP